MEKREFDIEIFKHIDDWFIRDSNFKFEKQDGFKGFDFFAKSRVVDNKIVYIFDNGLVETTIQKAKKDKIFFEECSFDCYLNKAWYGEGIIKLEKIEGTFIDALEYIKNKMQIYRDKRYE
jgi:hypothetical protein